MEGCQTQHRIEKSSPSMMKSLSFRTVSICFADSFIPRTSRVLASTESIIRFVQPQLAFPMLLTHKKLLRAIYPISAFATKMIVFFLTQLLCKTWRFFSPETVRKDEHYSKS